MIRYVNPLEPKLTTMICYLPLLESQKLNVVYRIEPGCLGPDGAEKVEHFCHFAQQQTATLDADYIHWEIVPRYNKCIPEMQYNINSKMLTHDKAARYLDMFSKDLDEFEEHLGDKMTRLIDQFLERPVMLN